MFNRRFCNQLLLSFGLLGIAAATSPAAPAAPSAEAGAAPTSSLVTAHADAPPGERLFYCSHSLMWDTPAPLGEDVAAYGIKDHVLVGLERIGFSTTKQHWDQPDGRNQSKKALDTGKVDDFIMSPMEMPDEGITNFVKYGLEKNPKMRFLRRTTGRHLTSTVRNGTPVAWPVASVWINGTTPPSSKFRN